jgi:hypothetical protein
MNVIIIRSYQYTGKTVAAKAAAGCKNRYSLADIALHAFQPV